jgi:predicted nucleotidyltransferase
MFEQIFDSRLKTRIIGLLVRRNTSLSGSEISRILNSSKSQTNECLKDLRDKGMLYEKSIGNTMLYSFSSNFVADSVKTAFNEENRLLDRIEKEVVSECKKLNPVSIVLFGSAVKGLKIGSDIDLLVLYEKPLDRDKLSDIASTITVKSGIHISPIAMNIKRFITDAKAGNEFTINIFAGYKLLYGKDLEALVWQEK